MSLLRHGRNDAILDFEKNDIAPVTVLNTLEKEYQKGYISELVKLYSGLNIDEYQSGIKSLLDRYKYNPIAQELLTKALDNYH